MLQTIHDKLKGWVAGIVLGAIGLVFIFWGINWTLSAPNYAAKVDGHEISVNEVREGYQRQLAQSERQANGTLTDAQRADLKKRVMDQYINSEALVTRTDDLGYRVGDQQVLQEMSQVPAFQVDGKFDLDRTIALLRSQGRSVAEIEELFRRDVKLRQLNTALDTSSFTTPTELKDLRALTKQQREVSWVTLSADKYAQGVAADEAQVKTYYDAHKSDYMTPESVDLHYAEISLTKLADKVKVDDAQLKAYYEEQKSKSPERFVQEEQRRVRHILFTVSDPKDDAAVKAKAEGVLKRIQGGEDFAKLAKELSQDPGSAPQGGDLGFSKKKDFVGPFADAAFAMKQDEVRGPVKTQFGYHILKLEGIQASDTKPFEQAKAELETEYKRNEAERLYNDAADKLADAALQNSDLDSVAKKAGLTVEEIPNFTRHDGGGALGKSQAVIDAAFSQDVLDGRLSPIVEVEKGRGVVLRSTDHKLPEQKPLDAVHDAVLAAWKKQRGAELAAAAANDAIKRLKDGQAWDAVVKSLGLTAPAPKYLARADQDLPFDVRNSVFTAAKPADKKTVYEWVDMPTGDAVLYAFSGVRENPADDGIKDPDLKRQYAQRIASGEAQSYAAGARQQAHVTINPQAID